MRAANVTFALQMATSLAPGGNGSALDPALFDDRSHHVIGASITLIIIPTIFVVLRLLSRWIARAGFWVRNGCEMSSVAGVDASNSGTIIL